LTTGGLAEAGSRNKIAFWSMWLDLNQGYLLRFWRKLLMTGTESTHDRLSSAKRRVAEARSIVESQKALIDRVRANGGDTEDAERTLFALVQTLTTLEGHLRSLYRSVQ
jgi:hypothetical protein